jgi:hypothetical protein
MCLAIAKCSNQEVDVSISSNPLLFDILQKKYASGSQSF